MQKGRGAHPHHSFGRRSKARAFKAAGDGINRFCLACAAPCPRSRAQEGARALMPQPQPRVTVTDARQSESSRTDQSVR